MLISWPVQTGRHTDRQTGRRQTDRPTDSADTVAAKDRWQQDKFEAVRNDPDTEIPELQGQKGPWNMGDNFWPYAEAKLADFMRKHSKQGGFREIATRIYEMQNKSLTVTESDAKQFCSSCVPSPTLGKRCQDIHAGYCKHDNNDIEDCVKSLVGRLHSIR